MLERESVDTPELGSSPQTPNSQITDLKSSGKSTWKQRHDQKGTVVREGDVGDG